MDMSEAAFLEVTTLLGNLDTRVTKHKHGGQ